MPPKEDYYAVLGIQKTADARAIRVAYHKLAKIKHPDKNPQNPGATAEFQLLQAAYSTLSDPEARRLYDTINPSSEARKPQNDSSQSGKRAKGPINRSQRLEELQRQLSKQQPRVSEARRRISGLTRDLEELEEKDNEDDIQEAASRTLWNFLLLVLPSRRRRRTEEDVRRDRRRVDREDTRRIKNQCLSEEKDKLATLEAAASSMRVEINQIVGEMVAEDMRRERAEREQHLAAMRREREAEQRRRQAERWANAVDRFRYEKAKLQRRRQLAVEETRRASAQSRFAKFAWAEEMRHNQELVEEAARRASK
ncbi:hypothetical protein F4778DRAFT_787528 [Xylariomycetidae sp. FL2044]|nr:hypothetical protein F4778DRAFT_787528 [Xylariomycetidae sp. FL2044]